MHVSSARAALGMAALTVATFGASTAFADLVILNDGKTIEGDVVDGGTAYEVKTRYGSLTVQKSDVKRIVKEPARVLAEAEVLRRLAQEAYDESAKLTDEKERHRKLMTGLACLESALKACQEAREVYPGPDPAPLDAALAGLRESIRRFQDKMAGERPAPPPVTNAPAVSPTPVVLPGPVTPTPLPAGKSPPPPDEAQRQAEVLIRNVFKSDYARRTPGEMAAFAQRLLQHGLDTKNDPAARFVLFREARDVAAQAGDAAIALKSVEATAQFYSVDPLAEKLAALVKTEGTAKAPEAVRILVEQYLRLMDEAIAADQYDAALRAGARAEILAGGARDASLAARVRERAKQVLEIQKGAAALGAYWKALESNPDDLAANAAVGKFLCFTKGDWEKGLPMLAKGTDPILKPLAAKELARPSEPAEQVSLADAWWDAAEKQGAAMKAEYKERAIYWYGLAAPKTTGLVRVRITARMSGADKAPPSPAPPADLSPILGFGGSTRGGAGHPVVRVTTLANAGPGSLRNALSKGQRTLVFDLGGEIALENALLLESPSITIDGLSAPAPGITIKGGLTIRGESTHDLIVRGLRVRGGGIGIGRGAHHVVLDHVSVIKSPGECLSISGGAHDVTVCWSIFADCGAIHQTALIEDAYRVSIHHSLFAKGTRTIVRADGMPDSGRSVRPPAAAMETTLDFRNNVVWGWGTQGWGLRIEAGVRANVYGNLFGAGGGNKDHAAIAYAHSKQVRIFASGNILAEAAGKNPNDIGDEKDPLPAPPIYSTVASSAVSRVLTAAGVRPLDAADQELIRATGLLR